MGNSKEVENYLQDNFQNLQLCMPLFYNWTTGIRFEIGCPDMDFEDKQYYKFAFIRSKMIFDEIFFDDTNIYIVINEHKDIGVSVGETEGINIYKKYLNDKGRYKEVEIQEIPYCYQEDGDEVYLKTFRYYLSCEISDFNYNLLLKTIVNQMRFGVFGYNQYNEIFFINIDKNIIYHLYSDEGLDIIAKEKGSLNNIYEKYNRWILDFDREKVSETFNSGQK